MSTLVIGCGNYHWQDVVCRRAFQSLGLQCNWPALGAERDKTRAPLA